MTPLQLRRTRALIGLCTMLVLAGCAGTPTPTPPDQPPERSAVQQAIHAGLGAASTLSEDERRALVDFYGQRDDRPAWFDADSREPVAANARFLSYLDHVDRQGLSRRDYLDSQTWAALQLPGARPPARLAQQDIALSRAFLRLARDIDRGRVTDEAVRLDWRHTPAAPDYLAALGQAIDKAAPGRVLDALTPDHAGYRHLVAALARYRQIQAAGGWPQIAGGPILKPGARDARVTLLRRRLRLGGDAPADDRSDHPTHYTSNVAAAVRHFQRRHGLHADGRVGPATLEALDVPVAARIHSIRLNLERWRWMPADFGDRYIAVNIPDFSLVAVDHGASVLSMNVIVGGTYDNRATPVFADRMRYLIFRPFWNVPHHIAVDEILPHARRDPQYMARRGYQLVTAFGPNAKPLPATPDNLDAVAANRLQVRQAGGRTNALGLVKFMFPNRYAVYLHSTPADRLFDRDQRDLSHGCVRVADPVALAQFALFGRNDWDRQRIEQAMHQGGRQRVNLARPLPVYLMYWTVFTNADGVNFRPDLYGRDARLSQALDAASAGPA